MKLSSTWPLCSSIPMSARVTSNHRSGQATDLGLVRPYGTNNSNFQTGMELFQDERKTLQEMVSTVSKATGHQVKGWRSRSDGDVRNAAPVEELGLTYVLDWCADYQPFALTVPGVMSVPYLIRSERHQPFCGKEFWPSIQIVVDQFDQLYKDGEKTGRVMSSSSSTNHFVINTWRRRCNTSPNMTASG